MRRPVLIAFGMMTLTLFMSTAIEAAEFFISKSTSGLAEINMTGAINEGDHRRLLSVIKNSPAMFLNSGTLLLSSPGGSVNEAIKIGEIVERASLMTLVKSGDSCASSCFLVFVAGPLRSASGRLLVHRPFIAPDAYDKSQTSDITSVHQIAMQKVRAYLEFKSVPISIIEKMMRLPSTEAHRLTPKELVLLGHMSPSFEEISIAKCGVSQSSLGSGIRMDEDKIVCVNGLRDLSRLGLLTELLGKEQAMSAVREYLLSKGLVENPDGIFGNLN